MSNITFVVPLFGPSSNVKYIVPGLPSFSDDLLIILTVLFMVASFPALSLTVYVMVYLPILFVSTLPFCLMSFVISPSQLSIALAPCSLY